MEPVHTSQPQASHHIAPHHRHMVIMVSIGIVLTLTIGLGYQFIRIKKSQNALLQTNPEQQELVKFYQENPYQELTETERQELIEFFEKNKPTQ